MDPEAQRRDYRVSLVVLEASAHVPRDQQLSETDTSVLDPGLSESQRETDFLLRYCAS